jgi:hypothetical protein
MNVAQTILAQLGGNQFIALTGAKEFVGGENFLQFRFGRGEGMRITLNGSDTYDVDHYVIRGIDIKDKGRETGLYADMLKDMFERRTGLYVTFKPRLAS